MSSLTKNFVPGRVSAPIPINLSYSRPIIVLVPSVSRNFKNLFLSLLILGFLVSIPVESRYLFSNLSFYSSSSESSSWIPDC